MVKSVEFQSLNLKLVDTRTYLFVALFAAGNLILPQLCHLIPQGGLIFLPIYFFTLIAAYKFGIKVGLLTALLSVGMNHLLFGMPPANMLPVILVKSGLLALIAGLIAKKGQLSILSVLTVVVIYQLLGGIFEWAWDGLALALRDIRIGWPGILVQVVAGWGLLQLMAKYE